MMAREEFGNRYACWTVDIPHQYRGSDPKKFCTTYARLPSGKIGEFVINNIDGAEKRIHDDVLDASKTASTALQYGESLESLAKSMLRQRGKPLGWMGSILDYLKKEPVDA